MNPQPTREANEEENLLVKQERLDFKRVLHAFFSFRSNGVVALLTGRKHLKRHITVNEAELASLTELREI